jgi:hypothetical protein
MVFHCGGDSLQPHDWKVPVVPILSKEGVDVATRTLLLLHIDAVGRRFMAIAGRESQVSVLAC